MLDNCAHIFATFVLLMVKNLLHNLLERSDALVLKCVVKCKTVAMFRSISIFKKLYYLLVMSLLFQQSHHMHCYIVVFLKYHQI